MVMEDGPFPCGAVRTWTWSGDGRVQAGGAMPVAFVGTEAVEMRNGFIEPIVEHLAGGVAPVRLMDAASRLYTDEGFVARYWPALSAFLRFNAAGDIEAIDWAAATSDGGEMLRRAMRRPPGDVDGNFYGFVRSLRAAGGRASWGDDAARALWADVVALPPDF